MWFVQHVPLPAEMLGVDKVALKTLYIFIILSALPVLLQSSVALKVPLQKNYFALEGSLEQ